MAFDFGKARDLAPGALALTILLGLACMPARAEAECAAAVRTLMQGAAPVDTPVKSRSTTTMAGGLTMVSLGLSEGKNHLTMDESGNPLSLFRDDKFYTTSDNGTSWTLVQTYSPEVMKQSRDGLATQAEKGRNITCAYGLNLDGKTVNHYTVDYELYNTATPMHGEYWVDAETGFPWKSLTVSDPGGNEIVIEQVSEPAPGQMTPDPSG